MFQGFFLTIWDDVGSIAAILLIELNKLRI